MSLISRQPLWIRILLSGWLVVHLCAMFASTSQELFGQHLRQFTRPYETMLGVHQNWPMFVGAPQHTRWLRFVGTRADGTEVELAPPYGRPDPHGVWWRYHRSYKFERNAVSKTRAHLHTALVRWQCRSSLAAGDLLKSVEVLRMEQALPAHGSDAGPRETWPVSAVPLGGWNCPR